nr:hypothetical protein [Nocardia sp. XZ_19_369]
MTLREHCGSACRVHSQRHIHSRRLYMLSRTAIELSAVAFSTFGIDIRIVVSMVQDQPELEARIRDGQPYTMRTCGRFLTAFR